MVLLSVAGYRAALTALPGRRPRVARRRNHAPVLGRETVLGSAEFGHAPTPLRVSRKKAFQFRSNTVR